MFVGTLHYCSNLDFPHLNSQCRQEAANRGHLFPRRSIEAHLNLRHVPHSDPQGPHATLPFAAARERLGGGHTAEVERRGAFAGPIRGSVDEARANLPHRCLSLCFSGSINRGCAIFQAGLRTPSVYVVESSNGFHFTMCTFIFITSNNSSPSAARRHFPQPRVLIFSSFLRISGMWEVYNLRRAAFGSPAAILATRRVGLILP